MEDRPTLRGIIADSDKTVILDGGLATELEQKGLNISTALWSAEIIKKNPKVIEEVHLDYFKAGADVAITSSYQASLIGLEKHMSMSSEEAIEVIKSSVELAQNAVKSAREQGIDRPLFVAGSVGPYGAYLANGAEYRGDYTLPHHEMLDFHRPRVQALVDAKVDIIAFETIPSFAETTALIELLQDFSGVDCWISFTMKDEQHISDGTPLSSILPSINGSDQVVAVGINCVPETSVSRTLQEFYKHTNKSLIAYPNSGEIYDPHTKTWSSNHTRGMELKGKALTWRSLGARLIGGCCRTTPEDIRTLREAFTAHAEVVEFDN